MNLQDMKQTLLSNPDVQKEYEALKPEYAVVRAVLEARKQARLIKQS